MTNHEACGISTIANAINTTRGSANAVTQQRYVTNYPWAPPVGLPSPILGPTDRQKGRRQ